MRIISKSVKASLLLTVGVIGTSGAMAALPTSGTCGFITNVSHPEVDFGNSQKGTLVISDILGSIDFSKGTVSYNATTLYNDGSEWQYGSVNGSTSYSTGSALSNPSGAYPITFTISGSNTFTVSNVSATVTVSQSETLNLFPTNSSNTLLIQGGNEKTTGVCQTL